ncbi:fluoride efflux transporter FluC [Staphylococcus americanisciuri]|uniref:Fluoride-specific ion channel FluC n=1 Tax=Staphylococcus americanisciuri TaxID=2973940 RepID=A0ABT2EYD4_9STAP|nr:CrcB family protein [Staphylococcus americanisciuri]MCS4485284.1 CrcB family protein [Staphylococcus americanisciuri]
MNLLLILLGGGLGATTRALITDWSQHCYQNPFHLATIIVNLIGSSLIGFMGGIVMSNTPIHALFIIGLLGGLTTFSTVQLELLEMHNKTQILSFFCYSFIQYIGCFACCYVGTLI